MHTASVHMVRGLPLSGRNCLNAASKSYPTEIEYLFMMMDCGEFVVPQT